MSGRADYKDVIGKQCRRKSRNGDHAELSFFLLKKHIKKSLPFWTDFFVVILYVNTTPICVASAKINFLKFLPFFFCYGPSSLPFEELLL